MCLNASHVAWSNSLEVATVPQTAVAPAAAQPSMPSPTQRLGDAKRSYAAASSRDTLHRRYCLPSASMVYLAKSRRIADPQGLELCYDVGTWSIFLTIML